MIGDPCVGKTAILNWLTNHNFTSSYSPTIGTGCGQYSDIIQGQTVELQIWDTAGQESYKSLGSIFYRNSDAAIIVFSHYDAKSIQSVQGWLAHFQEVAGPLPLIIIVGNQVDRQNSNSSEIWQWSHDHGYSYFDTSAKTGEGITNVFSFICQEIYKKDLEVPVRSVTCHS